MLIRNEPSIMLARSVVRAFNLARGVRDSRQSTGTAAWMLGIMGPPRLAKAVRGWRILAIARLEALARMHKSTVRLVHGQLLSGWGLWVHHRRQMSKWQGWVRRWSVPRRSLRTWDANAQELRDASALLRVALSLAHRQELITSTWRAFAAQAMEYAERLQVQGVVLNRLQHVQLGMWRNVH